jgi:hypothetical protein
VYAPSCTGCAAFLKNIIDSTRSEREHFVGGRISVTSSQVRPSDGHDGATAIIDLTFDQQSLKVERANGKVVETDPGIRSGVFRHWVRWVGGKWSLVDWKRAVTR